MSRAPTFAEEWQEVRTAGLPARTRRSLSEWFIGDSFPATPDDPAEALTYDALLTLEGWGVAEFREFPPEVQAAARWALFARRVAPMLREERALQSLNLNRLGPDAKLAFGWSKMRAGANIPILEAALGLGDG